MNNRLVLFLSCIALVASAAASRPNILLITVDDMNFDTPGCFGEGNPKYQNSGVQNAAGTFDWKTVRIRGKVPDDIKSGTVMLMVNGTGTAWFDNVQLTVGD